jgi:hypothetical protein
MNKLISTVTLVIVLIWLTGCATTDGETLGYSYYQYCLPSQMYVPETFNTWKSEYDDRKTSWAINLSAPDKLIPVTRNSELQEAFSRSTMPRSPVTEGNLQYQSSSSRNITERIKQAIHQ